MAKRGTEWLDWQTALLRIHFADTPSKDLVCLIGRNAYSIAHKAAQLKLKKSPEYLASPESGRIQASPIGTEFINRHGYVMRKVSNHPNKDIRWQAVHVMEWTSHYGPVPEGFMVCFKDGNKKNTSIENLELVSRREGLLRNTINRYPDEVKALIRLHHKLERTIDRRSEDA